MATDERSRNETPRYEWTWRAKWLVDGATSVGEMVEQLQRVAHWLHTLEGAGVRLEGPVERDYGMLVTNDEQVAKQFGFNLIEDDQDG
jgi:hypothetical protein